MKIGIIEFRNNTSPIHIIVIEDPYLGGGIRLLKQRPEMFDDKFGFALL